MVHRFGDIASPRSRRVIATNHSTTSGIAFSHAALKRIIWLSFLLISYCKSTSRVAQDWDSIFWPSCPADVTSTQHNLQRLRENHAFAYSYCIYNHTRLFNIDKEDEGDDDFDRQCVGSHIFGLRFAMMDVEMQNVLADTKASHTNLRCPGPELTTHDQLTLARLGKKQVLKVCPTTNVYHV